MFERILIAGRGEASARVARTCQRIGADTVALAAPGDEDAVHVQAADEVVAVDDFSVYRDPDRVIDLALAHHCVAVHPSYGFFDADPWLAGRGQRLGVTVIGPSADRLALYRDRVAMRMAAIDAGLRVLPGGDALIEDAADAMLMAREVGYPLVMKPGYGIGEPSILTIINEESELLTLLNDAEDPAFAMEAWVDRPRHVEIVLV